MSDINKKKFSDRQEKMVARYLGWHQVTGSGARPGIPGDVTSREMNYLGECKTFTSLKDSIKFQINHWIKIDEEATLQFKQPALFTDDGTQLPDHTFCIARVINSDKFNQPIAYHKHTAGDNSLFKINKSSIVIPDMYVFKQFLDNNDVQGIVFTLNKQNLIITTLEKFNEILEVV